MVVIANQYY